MSSDRVNVSRRRFLAASTAVVGAAGAIGVAVPFVGSWQPSAKAKAAGAPVRQDISKLQPGEMLVVEWRGKPVYIVNRTKEAIDNIAKQNDSVRDPESNESVQPAYAKNEIRSHEKHANYLILIGLCTHLGCAPKDRFQPKVDPATGSPDEQWLGGFFCPCHGSKFDLAGRVKKGVPAPLNLEVPPFRFESDTVVVIGEDGGAA
jgi:ubiquinol-cytochrome c reductase iron-sulfur subunit